MLNKLMICLIAMLAITLPPYSDDTSLAQETTGQQIAYASSDGLFLLDIDSGEVQTITEGNAADPAWSRDAAQLAYSIWADGDTEIFITTIADNQQTQITQNEADDFMPIWSPDGNSVVFASTRDMDVELYQANIGANSSEQRLTYRVGQDVSPSWSPDGTRLALFAFGDEPTEVNVQIMNYDNGTLEEAASFTSGYNIYMEAPAWSPDGNRVAFSSLTNQELLLAHPGRRTVRKVPMRDQSTYPVWSPDGSQIAFVKNSSETNTRHICLLDVETEVENCLTSGAGDNYRPAWSPDGSQIAFISDRDGNAEIYVMDADGSHLTRLTNTSVDEQSFVWRPIPKQLTETTEVEQPDIFLAVITYKAATGSTLDITWEAEGADSVCLEAIYIPDNEIPTCQPSTALTITETGFLADTGSSQAGDYEDSWILPAEGNFGLTITEDRITTIVFNFYIQQAGSDTYDLFSTTTAHIEPICEFIRLDNNGVPCPDEPFQEIPAIYQVLADGGFMVSFADKIFVRTATSGTNGYVAENGWDGVEVYTSDEPVPGGMVELQGGFGWFVNAYPVDFSFATGPEVAYTARFQYIGPNIENGGTPAYLVTLPDGNALFLDGTDGQSNTYGFQILAANTLIPIQPASIECDGAPPTRLAQGMSAFVTYSAPGEARQSLRVRERPFGQEVGTMPEGAQFSIIGGPVCVDTLVWWEVLTADGTLQGWSAEGQNSSNYFMAPQ